MLLTHSAGKTYAEYASAEPGKGKRTGRVLLLLLPPGSHRLPASLPSLVFDEFLFSLILFTWSTAEGHATRALPRGQPGIKPSPKSLFMAVSRVLHTPLCSVITAALCVTRIHVRNVSLSAAGAATSHRVPSLASTAKPRARGGERCCTIPIPSPAPASPGAKPQTPFLRLSGRMCSPKPPAPHRNPHGLAAPRVTPPALTQAVHAERRVIEEVADVPGAGGHGAEGVGAAGGQGVDAAGQQVGEEGPGVGVPRAPRPPQPPHQGPHEVPAGRGGERRARRVPARPPPAARTRRARNASRC